jgi:hypothetical protein
LVVKTLQAFLQPIFQGLCESCATTDYKMSNSKQLHHQSSKMKRFFILFTPLSILLFPACQMKYALTSTPIAPQTLTQQRLLIVTYDTDLESRRVVVKNVNMRYNDLKRSQADLAQLQAEFKPNYALNIRVGTERSRNFYTIQAKRKFKFKPEKTESRLRDANLDLEIVLNTEGGKNAALWHAQLAMKQLYQSEQITDVKKMVKKLSQSLQKDKMIE